MEVIVGVSLQVHTDTGGVLIDHVGAGADSAAVVVNAVQLAGSGAQGNQGGAGHAVLEECAGSAQMNDEGGGVNSFPGFDVEVGDVGGGALLVVVPAGLESVSVANGTVGEHNAITDVEGPGEVVIGMLPALSDVAADVINAAQVVIQQTVEDLGVNMTGRGVVPGNIGGSVVQHDVGDLGAFLNAFGTVLVLLHAGDDGVLKSYGSIYELIAIVGSGAVVSGGVAVVSGLAVVCGRVIVSRLVVSCVIGGSLVVSLLAAGGEGEDHGYSQKDAQQSAELLHKFFLQYKF